MKLGDQVRHVGWAGHSYGELVELLPDGYCSVIYPDGKKFSGIPLEVIESLDVQLARQRQDTVKRQVVVLLETGNFESATAKYNNECSDWWSIAEFEAHRSACMNAAQEKEAQLQAKQETQHRLEEARLRQDLANKVEILLNAARWVEAAQLFSAQCQSWWPAAEFAVIERAAIFVHQFLEVYRGASLAELDDLYKGSRAHVDFPVEDYVTLKLPRVSALLKSMGVSLDEEQIRAIAHPESRLLITARAGSGKTKTLCAKAMLSILDERLYADQVLILAFNKAAALTVKERLENGGKVTDYRNARTFHSLAYQLVKPRKKLLFDEGGEPSKRDQSRFVHRMMQRILNPAFKEAMVEYFRQELEQIEDLGRDLQPDEYMSFRRSLVQVTLEGKKVKSNGEKFIADFLFEHGIEHRYEWSWKWKADFLNGSVYRPDFSIVHDGRDYILEHWAIDPDDSRATLPSHWTITTSQYRAQIDDKRNFWKGKSIALLETHTGMLAHGRTAFENELRTLLQSQGIHCQRLPLDEIVRRVFATDFQISRIAELFLQFIQRAKKIGKSNEYLAIMMAKNPDPEPRATLFHQLALRAYGEYEIMLAEEGAMDFDDLLAQATEEVTVRGPSLSIHLGDGKMLPLKDLRWVLLDEYQDFSELYFRMLDAILKINPKIKLVAVGDDWQAINTFAGADLRFFEQFASYFPESSAGEVTTNYRSDSLVVNAGNKLMAGKGTAARASRNSAGTIQIINVHDTWIEYRGGDKYLKQREADAVFLPASNEGKRPSPSLEKLAKAVKLCVQKISQSPTDKVMLLARAGIIYDIDLADFRQLLLTALVTTLRLPMELLNSRITASTVHGSKGLEAHTVFILDATQGQFPKIHPDNLLFRPFGVTPTTVLAEERRLFYVAITRAKHRLFVLTEKGKESPYLDAFSPNEFQEDHMRKNIRQVTRFGSLANKISVLMPRA